MSEFTTTLTVIVPAEIKELAGEIARAFDPDSGGHKSFSISATDAEGNEYVVSHGPSTDELAGWTGYFLTVPEELFAYVSSDYATRWPDLPCPTLEDCTEFADAARCFVGRGLSDALGECSLVLLTLPPELIME